MVGDDTADSDRSPTPLPESIGISDAEIEAILDADHDARQGLARAEADGFAAFYREDIKALVGFVIKLGATLPQAEDVAQRTMTTLYERWATVRHPKAWTRKVAFTAFLRSVPASQEQLTDVFEGEDEPASPLLSPEARSELREEIQEITALLDALPAQQRMVMAYRMEEAYDDAEIAKALGTTPKAVRASVRRARAALTKQVRQLRHGGAQ
ncbi:sigma-70 family RNA polymerase sigma factor [Amycolatopsis sp. NPDC023774]|uniref:RNA polymerase sigma factor n=1 Tax=Amycolatopsis sp. NPDC023774 TaxID=3155015 RepID=UPI00340D11BD